MLPTASFLPQPLAELHLHLEGAIDPLTLMALRPQLDPAEVEAHYYHADFLHFLKNYVWVLSHLETPEDFAFVTRRVLEQLEAQGVRYVELNLSVGVMLYRKQDPAPIFDAVRRESLRAPFPVFWIFDAVRQFDTSEGMRVAELAAERIHDGVVAFGIGGDEARGPAQKFAEVCRFARNRGLRLSLHGGETTGPESVWEALRVGAHRIGHGIAASSDPELMRHLRENDIPLEICLSSNVATGAVQGLDDHPLRRLFDEGVPVVLNTDDPALFHTTLSREFQLAQSHFGFSPQELETVAANGFRYAFGPTGSSLFDR
jgi:aminodeoxyfutalosine deaminase